MITSQSSVQFVRFNTWGVEFGFIANNISTSTALGSNYSRVTVLDCGGPKFFNDKNRTLSSSGQHPQHTTVRLKFRKTVRKLYRRSQIPGLPVLLLLRYILPDRRNNT